MLDHAEFDSYAETVMQSWHCPGAAILVLKENDVLYERAFGLADVNTNRETTLETRFDLGSVTKSFTAMSAALLVDDGLLEWDRPVCEYLSDFILDDPFATRHVTVRDMLLHRTGMPRHDFSAWRVNLPREKFIARMRHLKFSATFREKAQYNNLMFMVVGHLVETIAGQPWEEFVQRRIFDPLGMSASNFDPTFERLDQNPAKRAANGHQLVRNEAGAVTDIVQMPFGENTPLSPGPAGSIFSTVVDLAQWLKVHINDGCCNGFRLVSSKNLWWMHAPQMINLTGSAGYVLSGLKIEAYGMGWIVRPYPYADGTLIYHNGTTEYHSATIAFVPEKKLGAVVVTNAGGTPLPSVLLRAALDRARGLDETDWNAKHHALYDPMIAAAKKRALAQSDGTLTTTPTTRSLEAFAGSFCAPGYPDFAVKVVGTKAYARTVDNLPWSELRHRMGNEFDWHLSIWGDEWVKTNFSVDDSGSVLSVSIPLADGVSDIVFTRQFPQN